MRLLRVSLKKNSIKMVIKRNLSAYESYLRLFQSIKFTILNHFLDFFTNIFNFEHSTLLIPASFIDI
jgi:hypothetical protein